MIKLYNGNGEMIKLFTGELEIEEVEEDKMNNKMPEVAKILGKELEEEFGIKERIGNYKLTEKGLVYKNLGDWRIDGVETLTKLLTGELKIEWTPKTGEWVWTIETYLSTPSLSKYEKNWSGSELQHKRGLKFKSQEEAIEKMKELGWWE